MWNPTQYLRFGDERTRPAADLLARVPDVDPRAVVDLGCGPGNSTRLLVERWPAAAVTGVDRSAEMLAAARAEPGLDRVTWIEAGVESWRPAAPPQVIYSNAMLQYVADHATFFPRLLRMLAPGGTLAVQIPYRRPVQPWMTALSDTAADARWSDALATVARPESFLTPAEYYAALAPEAASIDLWTTEYLHVLAGEDAVFNWTRGTALLPFLAALPADQQPAFQAEYSARLRTLYPPRADGRTLFPFMRLFLVAQRKSAS